ncbi:MAG: TonB-dependent receptor [Ectothiorhodospiraceae bacterium]|nr:TonB-dependent receptor [Ectothiorhodospiraceae bacterium]
MRRRLAAMALAPLVGFSVAPAAVAEEGTMLEPIVVTSPRLARDVMDTPAAVGVVDEEQLQQGRQQLQLDETLNRVPGVFFQNRYNLAQNLRLSIRGFGARAPFGIRGIRLAVDGIPETLPDGQSQVDMIDLESAQSVEVIRGPSSALYGNAAGGVVDIRTMDGPERSYAELRGTVGSDDFRRYGVRGGGQQGPWNAHISAWDMRYEGYRDQSRTEKSMINAKVRYDIDAGRSLTTVMTALDQPVGQDPAALTRQQVRENRRQATAGAEQVDAGQEVKQQRVGMIYRDAAAFPGELSVRAFYTNRDFRQQLPFAGNSLVEFDRDFFGAGADYTDDTSLLGLPLRYTVGTEAAWQRDDRQRTNISADARTQDELQKATNLALFSQGDLALTPRLTATLGVRYDHVRLEIDDRFGDQTGSGRRNFDEASGTLGMAYRLTDDHRVYGNVGTAYETPTFTEIKDADGGAGFSRDIDPQRAVNYEVGLKGFLGDRAQYDIAVFRVETRDEIIVSGSQDGVNEFDNAGRTRRDGLEAGIEYFLTPQLTLSGAYTLSRYRFRRFRDADERFDGNRMPGLPDHALFGELAWRDPSGVYAILDGLVIGRVYADNANDERVSGYGIMNARVGTTQRAGVMEVETFVAVNNLTNREYFSNIRVNANAGQYYEPAPERNFFAGVRARF